MTRSSSASEHAVVAPESEPTNAPSARDRVCAFESRRSAEMQSLIERFGATPLIAPSMREVSVEQNPETIAAVRRVIEGNADFLILLTGVGTDAMVKVAESEGRRDELLIALSQIPIVVRGPKPASALKRLGLEFAVKAPEPNTYVELVAAIDAAGMECCGRTVAVQEYGEPNPKLYERLEARGASVLPVPVYKWALPDDVKPMEHAIEQTLAGKLDALLFTSAQQVRHVLLVAARLNVQDKWIRAANDLVIGSIGPTCTQAIVDCGLQVRYEASPPKMGPLVRGTIAAIN